MKTDLAIVKKNLSHLRASSSQDSKFKVEFKKADGSLFSVSTLNIPSWLPDGEYNLTAYCLDTEEAEIILEHEILIEAKKEIPETSTPQIKNDSSNDLLFKLRDQDQASWERERNLINKYWETEVSRIRTETAVEIKTIKDKHEFEMNLMKANGNVLEAEREKMRDSIAKEFRSEKRQDNSNRKKSFGDRLLDMVDSNPDLLLAVFEKFNVVDPETVAALRELNKVSGEAN